jgi:tetratricopeptide (TPR) repeat protein
VYLVEDVLKEGRQSAMKILHGQDRSDRVADEQFRDEVSILAVLRHPNLVQVFDFGMIRGSDDAALQGRHFITMEYIRGVTVGEWFRGLRTDKDRALLLRHVILQALDVLAYVHRQGIIHFDIKPDNLLLIAGDEQDHDKPLLKLTDFGFSIRKDTALEFPLRGTLEYTAPELLRRDPFDHRIDLYSLGVTLYQLIENCCPFEAGDPVELIKKVLTTEPEFHRSADVNYAPFLPLLRRLLQKDPSRRFDSAGEAEGFLRPGSERATATAFDHVAKPGFVGREKERKQIGAAISSLGAGHPEKPEVAILILGPEGIGKTALLTEMVRCARALDVPVIEVTKALRDVPFGAVFAFLPFLRAEILSRSAQGVELMDKFAGVIETASRTRGENSKELQEERSSERETTIESLARFINQASVLFPLVVAVDDVDIMDPESREVLNMAVRDGAPGCLLVLLTERQEGGVSGAATRVPLGELDPRSVAAMSASILSPVSVSESIGSRLHQLYGGTPLIVVEALYAVDNLLRMEEAAETGDSTVLAEKILRKLPRDLDQFLFGRYRSLDRGRQLTLDILSCFSGPVLNEVILALLPFQRLRTSAYLSSLEALGIIAPHDGGQRCAIRHAKLKSMIGAAIRESRQEIHLAIASALESFPGARSFPDLEELAYQYREGGKVAAARVWLEAAADEGMRLAAYHRARELYQEAVGLVTTEDTRDSMRLHVKLARAMSGSGSFREAIDLANGMLGNGDLDRGQRTELHKIAGLALSRLGEYEDAKNHTTVALESCTDSRERVTLTQEMVGIDIALGNFLEAERAGIAQLDRAHATGNQNIVASIYTDLGIATFFQDLFDRSVGYFREAMKIYADSRQSTRVADAMMNIGNVMSAKGDYAKAVEYWRNALEISQDYGTLNQQAQIQNNLGIAHYKLKRFDEARSFYGSAKAIFDRLESKQGSAFVLTNLGDVAFAEGQYEQALLLWEDARELYREMEDGRGIVETMLQLAQVHLVLGDSESVAGNLDEAETLTNEKNIETFRAQLLYLRGMHLMMLCENEGARMFFKRSEDCTHDTTGGAQRLLLKVRMAECENRMGKPDAAAVIAGAALASGEREALPLVVAEACHLMGIIARSSPSAVRDKPIVFFRRGMDAVEQEPVTEITWKLALALGQEFAGRGQTERAKEYFSKAKLVLQYLVGLFTSSELKNQYLAVDSKQEALAGIELFTRT